jgi:hypothetical protein
MAVLNVGDEVFVDIHTGQPNIKAVIQSITPEEQGAIGVYFAKAKLVCKNVMKSEIEVPLMYLRKE